MLLSIVKDVKNPQTPQNKQISKYVLSSEVQILGYLIKTDFYSSEVLLKYT